MLSEATGIRPGQKNGRTPPGSPALFRFVSLRTAPYFFFLVAPFFFAGAFFAHLPQLTRATSLLSGDVPRAALLPLRDLRCQVPHPRQNLLRLARDFRGRSASRTGAIPAALLLHLNPHPAGRAVLDGQALRVEGDLDRHLLDHPRGGLVGLELGRGPDRLDPAVQPSPAEPPAVD